MRGYVKALEKELNKSQDKNEKNVIGELREMVGKEGGIKELLRI